MKVVLHKNDIPSFLDLGDQIAIDTEAMGLRNHRDRLCVIQLSSGNGQAHLVQFTDKTYDCPNLKKLLADPTKLKILHFARFDVAIIRKYLGITLNPVFCTKIASKLARTYTDLHGLKELCRELTGTTISKAQQTTDWGHPNLTKEQLDYAASDVLYLHEIKKKLEHMLAREGRSELAEACFKFLPFRAELDLQGWEEDIFAH
ncbi:ribonuclease D [Rickettsiales endosymbiont of Stachyamoeba lipophora]|uniref:ribonuclease D n=1 Tax=Rickettsiales endosymbiont of Stachyamoeba lipophora TaxID=2486578 RepID=UPI000F64EF4B|nr:ribonuclease D [Rickettsiales endosymbiont of Stachyamoeba lipophora]AZL15001.1 ribonuclease D [Rickettsiales endosymbiont of Stachyamoeba lipophora]